MTKGYDSNVLRRQIEDAGLESIIPYRRCHKVRTEINRAKYKERNIVERFIGKWKENRRVADHFAGFIILAARSGLGLKLFISKA